jgi:hypothetical protein
MAVEILYITQSLYIILSVSTEVFVCLDVLEFLVPEINPCVEYGDFDDAIIFHGLKPRFACLFQICESAWLS